MRCTRSGQSSLKGSAGQSQSRQQRPRQDAHELKLMAVFVSSPLVRHSRSEADKAYRLGLARKAKPVERLQQRYKAFQVRMLTPAPFIPEPSTATGSTSRTPARNALGTISTTAAGLSLSSTTPKANNGKRGGLAIFVDGEEDSDKKWEADLGTRDAVRKENEREAVSFKSAEVLPQGRGIAPRTPKLEVFRDEVGP